MNMRSVLLGSLVLNLLLLIALGWMVLDRNGNRLPSPASHGAGADSTNTAGHEALIPPGSTNSSSLAVPRQKFTWRMVESSDYRQFIDNLRDIGCPEETIGDIITADINKLFEAQKKELLENREPFKYWETGRPAMTAMIDPNLLKQMQELDRERRQVLKALLGEDTSPPPKLFDSTDPMQHLLAFLPEEKQNKVMAAYQQHQIKTMEAMDGNRSEDPGDLERMAELQKALVEEIAGLLSPEELERYQLHMSQTAMNMRMELDGFNPTEEEFQEIFKVRKEFEDEYSPYSAYGYGSGVNDDEEEQKRIEQREAARQEMEIQLRELLGEERYAEYKRVQDWEFKQLARIADRQGLKEEAAVQAYGMKQLAVQQANQLRNKSLEEEQKRRALEQIRAETEIALQRVLGEEGYQAMLQSRGTQWLDNIYTPPTPSETLPPPQEEPVAEPELLEPPEPPPLPQPLVEE